MRSPTEQLAAILESLSAQDQLSVLAFAEFLAQRSGDSGFFAAAVARPPSVPEPVVVPEPKEIPRPDTEKVIAAVKRLSQTYFMLDKSKMLGHTSGLVTQHVMHGRDAVDVIDELETVFRRQYEELKEQTGE